MASSSEERNVIQVGPVASSSEERNVIQVKPVASSSEERNAYRVLMGKPEGKRPLGRPGNTSSS